jgi:peroxiredoxin
MEKEIWQKYRDRGLAVFGVNAAERQDPEQMAKKFVAENGVTYPTLMDTEDEASGAYGIRALPTIAIIDKKGVLQYLQAGFNGEAVIAKIEALLAE